MIGKPEKYQRQSHFATCRLGELGRARGDSKDDSTRFAVRSRRGHRECLDHVIVWNERSLRRTLERYFAYYQRSRTDLALAKDAPESRVVEKPERGRVVAIPQVGGLHHRYQRQAAL